METSTRRIRTGDVQPGMTILWFCWTKVAKVVKDADGEHLTIYCDDGSFGRFTSCGALTIKEERT